MNRKLEHDWCERNKRPILEVLRRVLPDPCRVLEVGSGSGQHAVFFAKNQPGWTWQPSDISEENRASVRAWAGDLDLPNLLDPVTLDVLDADWGPGPFDVVYSANLIHVTPWECGTALIAGARRHLADRGLLVLYGPFRLAGRHTAASNAAFDEELRARDPRYGVRDLDEVCSAALGFALQERVEMPANNQLIMLRRDEPGRAITGASP